MLVFEMNKYKRFDMSCVVLHEFNDQSHVLNENCLLFSLTRN